jgi:hypothetical protein
MTLITISASKAPETVPTVQLSAMQSWHVVDSVRTRRATIVDETQIVSEKSGSLPFRQDETNLFRALVLMAFLVWDPYAKPQGSDLARFQGVEEYARVNPAPAEEFQENEEVLNWDAAIAIPPAKKSGTVRVTLVMAKRTETTPSDWPGVEEG